MISAGSQVDEVKEISVSITIGSVKVEFSGTAQSVVSSVLNFLTKEVPALELARKITLNFGAQELIELYGHLIKMTPEGPRVIPDSDTRLSDKETVALQLVAARLAKQLGKVEDDAMQVSEVQSATALNPKSISSRISEMAKSAFVARSEVEPGKYRITTQGIQWLGQTVAKKVKSASQ